MTYKLTANLARILTECIYVKIASCIACVGWKNGCRVNWYACYTIYCIDRSPAAAAPHLSSIYRSTALRCRHRLPHWVTWPAKLTFAVVTARSIFVDCVSHRQTSKTNTVATDGLLWRIIAQVYKERCSDLSAPKECNTGACVHLAVLLYQTN